MNYENIRKFKENLEVRVCTCSGGDYRGILVKNREHDAMHGVSYPFLVVQTKSQKGIREPGIHIKWDDIVSIDEIGARMIQGKATC